MIRRQLFTTIALFVVLGTDPQTASALTGKDWKDMGRTAQIAYVFGALDAWNIGGTDHFQKLSKCVMDRKMTGTQLRAIVDRYVVERPAAQPRKGDTPPRSPDLMFLTRLAIEEACR